MTKRIGTFFLAVVCAASCAVSVAFPRASFAATDGDFKVAASSGGGSIITGMLGNASITDATAALLRRVHAELGSKPSIVQSAKNPQDHSLALLFTAAHRGTPYTGVAIVTAAPGGEATGAALYDTTARFHTTVNSLMQRLQQMTGSSAPDNAAKVQIDPPAPLVTHAFNDGTGSIGAPEGWTVNVAGGGSALASAPGGAAQVSYNMHFGGLDTSNPRAQMWLRTASPLARAGFHGAILPYTSDPVKAWVAMFTALAKQHGLQSQIHVISSVPIGSGAANFIGTLGSGSKMIRFIAYAFVLPPNPMGLWTLSDSHVFVNESQLAHQGATANAVLGSVRINFGAVAAQQSAIRQMFQKQFEAEIANDRAQDQARQESTDNALAADRAAQEGMHKQAVSMENYSLDRAVVVNTNTGRHSTVDSGFADTLVAGNANYQKVPASGLLRGVDY